jgi:transposase
VLSVGHGRKSDPDDAVSVAVAARSVASLRRVGVEDQATVLHLLIKRRQDLGAARTQTINRLHRLLMDLVPGGARRNLTTKRAAALLAAVMPVGQPGITPGSWPASWWPTSVMWTVGSRSSRRVSRLRSPSPTRPWSSCSGWGRCWRPRSWAGSATFAGFPASTTSPPTPAPAPLEASSGQVVRHRPSRAGDRKLNHALYMMAMVQVRRPSAGQLYYRRKLAEASPPRKRCGASSAGCRMPSTGAWAPISSATSRLYELTRGVGKRPEPAQPR